jgi:AcrR family transcriptional regulator
MRAAMDAIAEHGLHRLRMTHIAELAGMSPGHILYYFTSKESVLVETLRFSETEAAERRRVELAQIESAPRRLLRFIDLYTPSGKGDPELVLWLEVWARSPFNERVHEVHSQLDQLWVTDLADVVAYGLRRREFASVDADEFAERFCALLDGYSIRVVVGHRSFTRGTMIQRAASAAARELGFSVNALAKG